MSCNHFRGHKGKVLRKYLLYRLFLRALLEILAHDWRKYVVLEIQDSWLSDYCDLSQFSNYENRRRNWQHLKPNHDLLFFFKQIIFCLRPGNIYKVCINFFFWPLINNRCYKRVKIRTSKSVDRSGDYANYFLSYYQVNKQLFGEVPCWKLIKHWFRYIARNV